MSDLAVLVPVLNRAHRVAPLLDAIEATTPGARVLFLADPNDHREIDAIEGERWRETIHVDIDLGGGRYAEKINRGVEQTTEPLIFLAADDLNPRAGWLEAATAAICNGVEVVGLNDLLPRRPRRRLHATHFLVTRSYAERPTIDDRRGPLCEVYVHNCVDDELIGTATNRGAYAFCERAHVEHLHWMNERAEVDATYQRGIDTIRADKALMREREPLWA